MTAAVDNGCLLYNKSQTARGCRMKIHTGWGLLRKPCCGTISDLLSPPQGRRISGLRPAVSFLSGMLRNQSAPIGREKGIL